MASSIVPQYAPIPPSDDGGDEEAILLSPTISLSSSHSPLALALPEQDTWTPPPFFRSIQLALMTSVFLYGLDSTITAATYTLISSSFAAANTSSWLTTSYLLTSTAFQPLYGRVSDQVGRRPCFLVATGSFAVGCLGCGLAGDMASLNVWRALAGFGGGGLMTMATIVNSDLIPFRRRGMYQAMQNGVVGFGNMCGASLGGAVADALGWRWCFLGQVPFAVVALGVGWCYLEDAAGGGALRTTDGGEGITARWKRNMVFIWTEIDLAGALLLVVAITLQLLGLSLGGNELPWNSPWVAAALVSSVVLLGLFVLVEARTTAVPIIPLRLLRGRTPVFIQIANLCAGTAALSFLFTLPLFFQSVLLDTASVAGLRLIIPSLAGPLGGLVAGLVMSRFGRLIELVRSGALLMAFGNALVASLRFKDDPWKYLVYIFPANLGQGIVMPGILFTSLASFEHTDHAVTASTVYLVRSLGSTWGVALSSAIVQTTLSVRLPDALGEIPDKWRVIDDIRHSVDVLRDLPPAQQLIARTVYYDGIRYAFIASTTIAGVAFLAAFWARGDVLRKTH